MLWRFRREIIFLLGLFLSLLAVNRSYVREFKVIEADLPIAERRINYDELIAENIRLREILDIKADKNYLRQFTVAEVISIRPFVFPAELVLNKGARDGLREDMTVLSRDLFLIGRIVSARNARSTVATIFNSKSRISVVTEKTREMGILEGGSIPYLSLKYIRSDSAVQKGERIFTSGYSDFYPSGVEVGEVVRIEQVRDSLFLHVLVKPYGCFADISEVLAGE